MTLTIEQIKTCRTPQEAMLVLATAIDHLHARIDELQPADLWQQPLEWGGMTIHADERVPEGKVVIVDQAAILKAQIAEVQERLSTCTDGEEIQALQAKLNLLRDEAGEKVYDSNSAGGGQVHGVPDGKRVRIESDGTTGSVDIPPPSSERMEARAAWAVKRGLHEFIPLSSHAAASAYAKGGPMWLYLGNREAVMQMPYEWRQELIADINEDSPAMAQEVGRDILKQTQSADRDITVQAVDALSASRGLR